MTRIKICGLSREEDIAAVNRWLPDYVGFVFAASKRKVTPEQAARLKRKLDARIKAVGVFTNESPDVIADLCTEGIIDFVQLHGDENEEYIRMLRNRTSCPIIKAVRVQSTAQILKNQELPCDMLLLDTFNPAEYGGSGRTFDLSLIPTLSKPYFLAGGLHQGNIADAIAQHHPFAVDISSGVETAGSKDEAKIREIVELVRRMN